MKIDKKAKAGERPMKKQPKHAVHAELRDAASHEEHVWLLWAHLAKEIDRRFDPEVGQPEPLPLPGGHSLTLRRDAVQQVSTDVMGQVLLALIRRKGAVDALRLRANRRVGRPAGTAPKRRRQPTVGAGQ
jgi:hypothetical protein